MKAISHMVTTTLVSLLLILFGVLAVVSPVHAQNQSADAACETLQVIDGSGECGQKTDDVNVNSTLEDVLLLLSYVAGVIAVIMIMIAGLRYITSQGDSQKVSQAKNAIIYSSIGLVVAALAQIIVRFILGAV